MIKHIQLQHYIQLKKFDSVLDKFELNIKISEIAGIKGEWNFDINLDKSNKKKIKYLFMMI